MTVREFKEMQPVAQAMYRKIRAIQGKPLSKKYN